MQASLGDHPRVSLGDHPRASLGDRPRDSLVDLRGSLVVGKGSLVSFLSLHCFAHICQVWL